MTRQHFKPALLMALALTVLACGACGQAPSQDSDAAAVYAAVETAPVASSGDAADDPAIWVNADDPAASRVLATDKRLGLAVYDLAGRELQMIERGRLNNVDLRQSVPLEGRSASIAVATNRSEISLDVFEVAANGEVTFVLAEPLDMDDPYGICMMRHADGNASAFVNDKSGEYQHWQITRQGRYALRLLGGFTLDSQPEGCVVDDAAQILYAGEEARGIWMLPVQTNRAGEMRLIDQTGAGQLNADVEGLGLYRAAGGAAYLIASSQGSHSFAVYRIDAEHAYQGSFRVADAPDSGMDGAEETDGLDATSTALGDAFPQGMLVVQDGFNRKPKDNQNFKLVDWRQVAEALELE